MLTSIIRNKKETAIQFEFTSRFYIIAYLT